MYHVIYPTVVNGVMYGGIWGNVHLRLSAGQERLKLKHRSTGELKANSLLGKIRLYVAEKELMIHDA